MALGLKCDIHTWFYYIMSPGHNFLDEIRKQNMKKSIDEYQTQLESVKLALQANPTDEERTSLEELERDLLELVELTKETFTELKNSEELKLGRFSTEAAQLKPSENFNLQAIRENQNDNIELKVQEFKEKIVGQKCSAPHQHTWGSKAYHNAIVCAVEDAIIGDKDSIISARLRVLFTNPTHREMLPCSYYLNGDCRFGARCNYSHGEVVAMDDLHPFLDADFTHLARKCVVLAKLPDCLWYRGRVLCANFVEKLCRVRLDEKNRKERDRDFPFENLLPLFKDYASSASSSDSNDDNIHSRKLDNLETLSRTHKQSLFEIQSTESLGDWEKHTRGIGSKIMSKMGYVFGTGLGSDGQGITIPIATQIFPQRCSLDYCMELRHSAARDDDLISAEKKLRRQQRKQEIINAKIYAHEEQRSDVFSFLNDNIFASGNSSSSKKVEIAFNQQTTKSLNIASVYIADNIKRKEREIARMQKSLERNARGTNLYVHLQQQMQLKIQELKALQKEEKTLSKEQTTRKTKNKLCIF